MTLVARPDLSQRTTLSKSALVAAGLCGAKAWFDIHERRPIVRSEKITFGSAVDAAVEQVLTAVRAGVPIEQDRYMAAAEEVVARDEVEVDLEDVDRAATRFVIEVLPKYDFALCGLQVTLREDLDGLEEAEGHPDVRLHDGSLWDVKTAAKSKPADAAATSVELGFYALLSEAERRLPVPRVGYWTWVRVTRPYWQILEAPVTDEMRRRTFELAAAYVRAKKADALLNRNAETPLNFTFPSGPKNLSLCSSCQYSPAFGGPCVLAVQGAVDDVA